MFPFMFPLLSSLAASVNPGLMAVILAVLFVVSTSVAVFGMAGIRVRPTDDFMRVLIGQGLLDLAGGPIINVVAKTGNYAIVAPSATGAGDPSGTIFTNRGAAGAVTFTLPAVTLAMAGMYYDFISRVGQNFGVAGPAGAVTAFNNAAATSVTAQTAAQLIGAHLRAWCDGQNWYVVGDTVGVTYTVA